MVTFSTYLRTSTDLLKTAAFNLSKSRKELLISASKRTAFSSLRVKKNVASCTTSQQHQQLTEGALGALLEHPLPLPQLAQHCLPVNYDEVGYPHWSEMCRQFLTLIKQSYASVI